MSIEGTQDWKANFFKPGKKMKVAKNVRKVNPDKGLKTVTSGSKRDGMRGYKKGYDY